MCLYIEYSSLCIIWKRTVSVSELRLLITDCTMLIRIFGGGAIAMLMHFLHLFFSFMFVYGQNLEVVQNDMCI